MTCLAKWSTTKLQRSFSVLARRRRSAELLLQHAAVLSSISLRGSTRQTQKGDQRSGEKLWTTTFIMSPSSFVSCLRPELHSLRRSRPQSKPTRNAKNMPDSVEGLGGPPTTGPLAHSHSGPWTWVEQCPSCLTFGTPCFCPIQLQKPRVWMSDPASASAT